MRRQSRLVWAAAALALLWAALLLGTGQGLAESGVPIPAAPGTAWKIAGGYNTGTHSAAEGNDPHAIDLVRTDAPTDWTPVLSPVDGIVQWYDQNCVMVVDAREVAHLLCHIRPAGELRRELPVSVGDVLGEVFPPGYDVNGGLAHIHYALHQHQGGGRLGGTIPFVGDYALEGTELPWSETFNLHSGLEFVSTNSVGRVEAALEVGANLVSWQGPTADAGAALGRIAGLSHAFRWDAEAQMYLIWAPGTPFDSLQRLEPGDQLWVVVREAGVWVQG